MAKRRKKRSSKPMSSMTCPPSECGAGCMGWSLLGAIFAALGLWLLVGGVMKQWSMMPWHQAALWYLGGFLLWCLAKKCKLKACMSCK